MKDRQLAWEDEGVRELVKGYLPATDEVEKLQRGNTSASRFFRKIMTRNYSNLQTTQGTYLVTPSGELLGYGAVVVLLIYVLWTLPR